MALLRAKSQEGDFHWPRPNRSSRPQVVKVTRVLLLTLLAFHPQEEGVVLLLALGVEVGVQRIPLEGGEGDRLFLCEVMKKLLKAKLTQSCRHRETSL